MKDEQQAVEWPQLERVSFEEDKERIKVVLPVDRRWPWLGLYTVLVLVWVGSLVLGFGYLFTTVLDIVRETLSGFAFFVYVSIILLILYLWLQLGRRIARWWQYYLADREILFIRSDIVIIRRPVSLFGVTDAYDRAHMSPFFFSDKHRSPAFRYGNRGILFGDSLTADEQKITLAALNQHLFPHWQDDDEDDDEL
ncbi:MAG TPA: hypothetical protein VLL52_03015 [Anaerolineae bacterium]|nr:hypothetical protein [Anaerolineae bacterium]